MIFMPICAMDNAKCMHGVQMNVLYNGRLGTLLTLKLSTMQSKGIVLFPCEL